METTFSLHFSLYFSGGRLRPLSLKSVSWLCPLLPGHMAPTDKTSLEIYSHESWILW
jgi:hypothetical protein